MVLPSETAIDGLARDMIERHGAQAALRAAERVNDQIDKGDREGSYLWAAVVHVIHELQHAEPFSPLPEAGRPPVHQ
jgi:hypothetical protein